MCFPCKALTKARARGGDGRCEEEGRGRGGGGKAASGEVAHGCEGGENINRNFLTT